MTIYMTQSEFSVHRGISQPRVSKMISNGKIPKSCMKKISGRKLIDQEKADIALGENLDRIYNPENKAKPKSKKPPAPKLPPDAPEKIQKGGTHGMTLADAQKLQAQYKAALMKLEYEEKSGKLVNIETVEKDWFDTARLTRDAVLNISGRISSELATISSVHLVNKRMIEELNKALTELKI